MQDWLFFSVGPDMDWAGCILYIIWDQREEKTSLEWWHIPLLLCDRVMLYVSRQVFSSDRICEAIGLKEIGFADYMVIHC
jgi:hypothetical protein